MKSHLKIIIPISAAALLLIVFAGLWLFTDIFTGGSDGGNTETAENPGQTQSTSPDPADTPEDALPLGVYTLVGFEEDGEDLYEAYISMGYSLEGFCIVIMDDGRFLLGMEEEVSEGTYTVSGNVATLVINDEARTATIEGDMISFDFNNALLVFKWNPDFTPPESGADN